MRKISSTKPHNVLVKSEKHRPGLRPKLVSGKRRTPGEKVPEKKISLLAKKSSKATLLDAAEGRTLFIQSIPADVTDEELRTVFASYGELLYAKVVKHTVGDTVIGKGTGFVKYEKKEDAESVVSKCSNCLLLKGNILRISIAVEKSKLPEISKGEKGKKIPKRYVHLLSISQKPDKDLNLLDSKEIQRRKQKWREVDRKLQSNPNTFVNPFCVTLSNISPNITEENIRKMVSDFILRLQYSQYGDEVLQKVFEKCKEPVTSKQPYVKEKLPFPRVRLVKDSETSRSKGFCYLKFHCQTTVTPELTLLATAKKLTPAVCVAHFLPKNHKERADKIFCIALHIIAYCNDRPLFPPSSRLAIAQFAVEDKRALLRLSYMGKKRDDGKTRKNARKKPVFHKTKKLGSTKKSQKPKLKKLVKQNKNRR